MDHSRNSTGPLETLDHTYQVFLVTLYSLTAFIAFVSNLITIVVLFKGRRCTRDLRKFLINLSVADLMMALFTIPFTYTNYMFGRWIFWRWMCPLVNMAQLTTITVSIYTLVAIAIDRYFAIMHPLQKSISWFKTHRTLIVIIVWVFGIVIGMSQLYVSVTDDFTHNGENYLSCGERWPPFSTPGQLYTAFIFATTFALPMVVLCVVYTAMGCKLMRYRGPGQQREREQQQKLKTHSSAYDLFGKLHFRSANGPQARSNGQNKRLLKLNGDLHSQTSTLVPANEPTQTLTMKDKNNKKGAEAVRVGSGQLPLPQVPPAGQLEEPEQSGQLEPVALTFGNGANLGSTESVPRCSIQSLTLTIVSKGDTAPQINEPERNRRHNHDHLPEYRSDQSCRSPPAQSQSDRTIWPQSEDVCKNQADESSSFQQRSWKIISIRRNKVLKMLITIIGVFTICWLPIQLFNVMIYFKPNFLTVDSEFKYYTFVCTYFFCHWISMAHSFMNPIIYSFMSKNFKDDIRYIFTRFWNKYVLRRDLRSSYSSSQFGVYNCNSSPGQRVHHQHKHHGHSNGNSLFGDCSTRAAPNNMRPSPKVQFYEQNQSSPKQSPSSSYLDEENNQDIDTLASIGTMHEYNHLNQLNHLNHLNSLNLTHHNHQSVHLNHISASAGKAVEQSSVI